MRGVLTTAASRMLQRYVPTFEVRRSVRRCLAPCLTQFLRAVDSHCPTERSRRHRCGQDEHGASMFAPAECKALLSRRSQDEFGMGSFTMYSAHGPTVSPLVGRDRLGAAVAPGSRNRALRGVHTKRTGPRSAGGSSGGSAAAVAAGTAFAALGTDTGVHGMRKLLLRGCSPARRVRRERSTARGVHGPCRLQAFIR